MDVLRELLQYRSFQLLVVTAICILLIFLLAKFISSFVRAAIFVLLLGSLLFAAKWFAPQVFDWIPDVKKTPNVWDIATLPSETANHLIEAKVKPSLQEELQQAKITRGQDGSYVITTPHTTLSGDLSKGTVSVSYLGQKPFTVNDTSLRPLIEPLLQKQGQ